MVSDLVLRIWKIPLPEYQSGIFLFCQTTGDFLKLVYNFIPHRQVFYLHSKQLSPISHSIWANSVKGFQQWPLCWFAQRLCCPHACPRASWGSWPDRGRYWASRRCCHLHQHWFRQAQIRDQAQAVLIIGISQYRMAWNYSVHAASFYFLNLPLLSHDILWKESYAKFYKNCH